MYLSDRDLAWAIETGRLIVRPPPEAIDATSIDLHLSRIEDAKIWDIDKFTKALGKHGKSRPEVHIGKYVFGDFATEYTMPPPEYEDGAIHLVMQRGHEVVVRPQGFLLWPTEEEVGTPEENADFICFINGKSTKARAGMVVHLTAPTIHSSWKGVIVLEIVNLGPFDLVFQAGDAIAQLTVSRITSPPAKTVVATSMTYGQTGIYGRDDSAD